MSADAKGADPLLGNELCAGLTEGQVAAVVALGVAMAVEPGSRVFMLGQEAQNLFLIERGMLALSLPLSVRGETREITVQECSAGALVGWSALVPPHRYTLSAQAGRDVRLVRYARSDLDRLFIADPRLNAVVMKNLARVIAERLTQLQAMLLRDLQRRVVEKG